MGVRVFAVVLDVDVGGGNGGVVRQPALDPPVRVSAIVEQRDWTLGSVLRFLVSRHFISKRQRQPLQQSDTHALSCRFRALIVDSLIRSLFD